MKDILRCGTCVSPSFAVVMSTQTELRAQSLFHTSRFTEGSLGKPSYQRCVLIYSFQVVTFINISQTNLCTNFCLFFQICARPSDFTALPKESVTYKSQNSAYCNIPNCSLPTSFLGLNISPSSFSGTCILRPYLNVKRSRCHQ